MLNKDPCSFTVSETPISLKKWVKRSFLSKSALRLCFCVCVCSLLHVLLFFFSSVQHVSSMFIPSPTLPRSTPVLSHLCHLFALLLNSESLSVLPRRVASYWSVVNLSGAISLKKTDLPSNYVMCVGCRCKLCLRVCGLMCVQAHMYVYLWAHRNQRLASRVFLNCHLHYL